MTKQFPLLACSLKGFLTGRERKLLIRMENAAKPTESNEQPYKNSLEIKFMDSPVLTESLGNVLASNGWFEELKA